MRERAHWHDGGSHVKIEIKINFSKVLTRWPVSDLGFMRRCLLAIAAAAQGASSVARREPCGLLNSGRKASSLILPMP